MKRIAHVLSGVRRGEQGFSMAEIVVAITFFVAAILGAASMMISGGSLISGSAMANTAMRLASAKIEEVKSIPFYVPSVTNPADIDDSYWRFDAQGQPLSNADQITAPWRDDEADPDGRYQKYGDISGFSSYKRTTTVQYVYVVSTPSTHLAPAVMNSNWVPGNPGSGEDDRPKGGADASKTDLLHMLTIEVKVSYMENGTERTFTERALADDLMGPGTDTEGVMVVQSISPSYGYRGRDILDCTISIDAAQMVRGENVVVTLWRAGCRDIPTTLGDALTTSSSSTIDCTFDLETITDQPLGYYNVSVYWKRMSFKDSNLRNCFELREKAMWIKSVTTEGDEPPAWGFEKQGARTLSIGGIGFTGANAVNLRSGDDIISGGNITVISDVELTATFNLSLQTWSPNMQWDLEVRRVDGNTDTKKECFILNPTPQVTGVADPGTEGGIHYFDWAYKSQTSRNVKLTGRYLYGLEDYLPSVKLVDDSDGQHVHECTAVSQVAPDVSDTYILNHWKKDTWVIIEFNPSTGTEGGFDLDSKCSVAAQNYGGISVPTDRTNNTQNVWMNPTPRITALTPDVYYRKQDVSGITLNGEYFQPEGSGVRVYLDKSGHPDVIEAKGAVVTETGVTFRLDLKLDPTDPDHVLDWGEWQDEAGTWNLHLVNLNDGQSASWSTTINNARPELTTFSPTSGGYNYWNILFTATGKWFPSDGKATRVVFKDGGTEVSPGGVYTVYNPNENDNGSYISPNDPNGLVISGGNYDGSWQTARGLLNLISMTPKTYNVYVRDRETGLESSQYAQFTVSYTTPKVLDPMVTPGSDWDFTSTLDTQTVNFKNGPILNGNGGCTHSGYQYDNSGAKNACCDTMQPTFGVIAMGMYSSGAKQIELTASIRESGGGVHDQVNTITPTVVVESRSRKMVYTAGKVASPWQDTVVDLERPIKVRIQNGTGWSAYYANRLRLLNKHGTI